MVKNYLTSDERKIANNHLKIAMAILLAGFILSVTGSLFLLIVGFLVAGIAGGYAFGTDTVFRHIDQEREAVETTRKLAEKKAEAQKTA